MKNDANYFLENLSCGIWRIKSNCKIEQLRAPNNKARLSSNNDDKISSSVIINQRSTKQPILSDDQILSSTSMAGDDPDLFSIEF